MSIAPPMPYSGGKQSIAERIADTFPPHHHYVEPYAGALSVLLAKKPAPIETVNDLNGDIVNFWRVLRDQPERLERLLALTPHSRAEYLATRNGFEDAPDDLERARRVWVALTQSRGSMLQRSGWRFVHGTNRFSLAAYLTGYTARVAPAAERLRRVSLECRPALDVIAAYERPDALIYVDPPYLGSTRKGGQYVHEMTSDNEHSELLAALVDSPAMVALSGYDSPLYAEALTGWHVTRMAATDMNRSAKVECLWTNYEPHTHTGDLLTALLDEEAPA